MKPATLAALRTFAASARHSPEPSQAVADLALLIAELEEGDQAPADQVPPVSPIAPGDFDELAFPPVTPVHNSPAADQVAG
jgi:hypothetical protein